MKLKDGRKLFVDLDGVLADFESHYKNTFGHTAREAESDEKMWSNVLSHYKFFRNLPLFEGSKKFFDKIAPLNPYILTSCPHRVKKIYQRIAVEKREYVHEHFSKDVMVLPMLHGDCKWLFMHQPGDILIDDWKVNIQHWNEAGGIGIKHVSNDFETTWKNLEQYIDTTDYTSRYIEGADYYRIYDYYAPYYGTLNIVAKTIKDAQ